MTFNISNILLSSTRNCSFFFFFVSSSVFAQMQPFKLQEVRITDGPFKNAQEVDINIFWI